MSETTDVAVQQTDDTITLSKVFDAPRELVFSMFKDPRHLEKWWGPTTWPATVKSFDFTPGGVWHYYMTGPDGTKAWGKATFETIDEPNSLTYVDAFSNEAGDVDSKLPVGATTVTFEDEDGKTRLTTRTVYADADEVQKLVEMGVVEGVTDSWNQLERLLK